MALFLEMEGIAFKPQAYEHAAYAVAAVERPRADLYAAGGVESLDALPGIGKGIARRIGVMLETGTMPDLEALRAKTPIDVLALTAVEGIGAKRARGLWEALQVHDVAELKRAAEAGQVRALPHFGERSEQKLLEAIDFYERWKPHRTCGTSSPTVRPGRWCVSSTAWMRICG